jgi:hypothetical protein
MGPEAGAVLEALTGVPNESMGSRLGVSTEGLRPIGGTCPPPRSARSAGTPTQTRWVYRHLSWLDSVDNRSQRIRYV